MAGPPYDNEWEEMNEEGLNIEDMDGPPGWVDHSAPDPEEDDS